MESKRCTKCKTAKPVSDFCSDRSRGDGLSYFCRSCARSKGIGWRERNPEKASVRRLAWAKAHPEEHAQQVREWRRANPQKASAAARRSRRANLPADCAKVARRRASKYQATPKWVDHAAIKSLYARAAEQRLHVDHIVPLHSPLVCGLHVHHNLQLLPAAANHRKSNRLWPDMP